MTGAEVVKQKPQVSVAWCGTAGTWAESYQIDAKEALANAQLIALAPNMLRVLQEVLCLLDDIEDPHVMGSRDLQRVAGAKQMIRQLFGDLPANQ